MALLDRNKQIRIEYGKKAINDLCVTEGNNIHINFFVSELEKKIEKQQKILDKYNALLTTLNIVLPKSDS